MKKLKEDIHTTITKQCCERDIDFDGNCDRHPKIKSRHFAQLETFKRVYGGKKK